MKKALSLIKSSFHDIRCCDEQTPVVVTPDTKAWRPQTASITCVLDSIGNNTGYAHLGLFEEYTVSTGVSTGNTKPNLPSDPNYVPDWPDAAMCAKPVQSYFSFLNNSNLNGDLILKNLDGSTNAEWFVSRVFTTTKQLPAGNYSFSLSCWQKDTSVLVDFDIMIGSNIYHSINGQIAMNNLPSPLALVLYNYGQAQNLEV